MSYLFCFLISIFICTSQKSYQAQIKTFQNDLNTSFSDEANSPLLKKDLETFKSLNFFDIDETYKVEATFNRTPEVPSFAMKTTTDRLPMYDKYGEATFTFKGNTYTVSIYQNHKLRKTKKYKNHLFFPFTDLSNGKTTYYGGRYIDLTLPNSDKIILDFNKAYNPYCAYNPKYSCPIPPKENQLNFNIKAGVKKFH